MAEMELAGRPHSTKNSWFFHLFRLRAIALALRVKARDYRTPERPQTMCYNRRHACPAAAARAGPVFRGLCGFRPNSAPQKTNPIQSRIGRSFGRLRRACALDHFASDGASIFAIKPAIRSVFVLRRPNHTRVFDRL